MEKRVAEKREEEEGGGEEIEAQLQPIHHSHSR